MTEIPTMLRCPRCGKPAFWQDNPARPFCSEQCKLIDLGAWASDDYRIPSEDAPAQDSSEDDES